MKLSFFLSTMAVCIIFFSQCGNRSEFKDKRIILGNKETVKIKELDLTIINNGCGRKWMVDEKGKSAGEIPFCELIIKHNDSTINAGSNFEPVNVGNATIILDKINPWGIIEDSVPPGGCRLLIRKLTH